MPLGPSVYLERTPLANSCPRRVGHLRNAYSVERHNVRTTPNSKLIFPTKREALCRIVSAPHTRHATSVTHRNTRDTGPRWSTDNRYLTIHSLIKSPVSTQNDPNTRR